MTFVIQYHHLQRISECSGEFFCRHLLPERDLGMLLQICLSSSVMLMHPTRPVKILGNVSFYVEIDYYRISVSIHSLH